jgi:hypothetical protein
VRVLRVVITSAPATNYICVHVSMYESGERALGSAYARAGAELVCCVVCMWACPTPTPTPTPYPYPYPYPYP